MALSITMQDLIEKAKLMEVSYRNLHNYVIIRDKVTEERIRAPFTSIINKYRDFLSDITYEVTLTDVEYMKYRYAPKTLSQDLYGTTEYWFIIMELNNCITVANFNSKTLKIYEPEGLNAIINEIMILENIIS